MEEVGRNYRLRILLVLVDDENNLTVIQELNKIAFVNNFTLILTWSKIECARYLETWKSFETKSSAAIQAKEETEFMPKLSKLLTSVRSINKTDVVTLVDVFSSFSGVCQATEEQLVLCPGLGEKKVRRLYQTLNVPFQPSNKKACIEKLPNASVCENQSYHNNVNDAVDVINLCEETTTD